MFLCSLIKKEQKNIHKLDFMFIHVREGDGGSDISADWTIFSAFTVQLSKYANNAY